MMDNEKFDTLEIMAEALAVGKELPECTERMAKLLDMASLTMAAVLLELTEAYQIIQATGSKN